jgi:CubicO group peptidase (beta-lactamase class C family)
VVKLLSAVLIAGLSAAPAVAQSGGLDSRIERVENGLLPSVALEGARLVPHNILDRMRLYSVPGLSVAVINEGKVEWAKGYGVLESGGDGMVDCQTLFQAASITKPVMASLVLRLVELGLIDLDTPVNNYLKSWKIPENMFTKQTPPTLRHILAHRAGLTVHGFRGYTEGERIPNVYQILDGVAPANNDPIRVDVVPNTEFRYSGGGYVVLQLLLTELGGRPLRELMRRYVLEPAGMSSSAMAYPLDTELRINAAAGHRRGGEIIQGKYRVHPEIGAGGLWTTPTDLCRWAVAIQKSYAGEDGALLRQKTAREMLSPVDGSGLGPVVTVEPNGIIFSHDGSNAGYFCRLIAYADRRQGVAVMLNSDNSTIIGEVVRAVAQEYEWPHFRVQIKKAVTLTIAQMRRFAAHYRLGSMEFEIRSANGQLFAVMPGGVLQRLHAASATELFNVEDNIVLNFTFDEEGRFLTAGVTVDGLQRGALERKSE